MDRGIAVGGNEEHGGSFQTGTREKEPISIATLNQPKPPERLTERAKRFFGKLSESAGKAIIEHIEENPLP